MTFHTPKTSFKFLPVKALLTPGLMLGLAASLTVLAGCNGDAGLGDGNRVESLEFLTDAETLRQDDCVGRRAGLIANFTDGGIGNFTFRSDYTSSDESVVTVAETGLLQPQAPGTAVITAQFLDFTDTYNVTITDAYIPDSAISTTQGLLFLRPETNVAAGLTYPLEAYAVLSDDTTLEVTNLVEFTIDDEAVNEAYIIPEDAVAGTEITVTATLCNDEDFPDYPERTAQTTLTVQALDDLTIDAVSDSNIPVGLTSSFTVTGEFANGDQLNLTNQSIVVATASDDLGSSYAIASSSGSFFAGVVTGINAPSAGVTQAAEASVEYAVDTNITGNIAIATLDATLQSLRYSTPASNTPDAPTMLAGTIIRSTSVATFDIGDFDVTPAVSVSISDEDDGLSPEIVNFNGTESYIFAASGQAGTETLTATLLLGSNAPNLQAEDTLELTVIDQSDAMITSVDIVANSCQTGACAATITFIADGVTYTQDATKSVNWVSSNNDIIRVSGLIDNRGELAYISSGTVDISANFVTDDGDTFASTSVNVNSPNNTSSSGNASTP